MWGIPRWIAPMDRIFALSAHLALAVSSGWNCTPHKLNSALVGHRVRIVCPVRVDRRRRFGRVRVGPMPFSSLSQYAAPGSSGRSPGALVVAQAGNVSVLVRDAQQFRHQAIGLDARHPCWRLPQGSEHAVSLFAGRSQVLIG